MPQLKELSLYFTASSHRSWRHLSGGAAHPSTQLATLHGGEPVGPATSGVPGSNFPGPRCTPRVSAQQTTKPIRLTPSDHSGCELTPDPSVDSQGWYREWVHNQKPEILQQTILVHIDIIIEMKFHPKNSISVRLDNNDMWTPYLLIIDAMHNENNLCDSNRNFQ